MDDSVQLCGGSERPGSAAVAHSAMMKVKMDGKKTVTQLHRKNWEKENNIKELNINKEQ